MGIMGIRNLVMGTLAINNNTSFMKMATVIICTVLIFSLILNKYDHEHFVGIDEEDDKKNRFSNRVYYVLTTMSTVGYGDIYPKTQIVKRLSMIMMFFIIIPAIDGLFLN